MATEDKGICKNCIFRKIDCMECDLDCDPKATHHYEGWGWTEEAIEKHQNHRMCALEAGTCKYYLEDKTKIIYCKDCKYGVKKQRPDINGLEWDCTRGRIGATWSGEGECCPCGEEK